MKRLKSDYQWYEYARKHDPGLLKFMQNLTTAYSVEPWMKGVCAEFDEMEKRLMKRLYGRKWKKHYFVEESQKTDPEFKKFMDRFDSQFLTAVWPKNMGETKRDVTPHETS